MTASTFNLETIDSSWHNHLNAALKRIEPSYLTHLQRSTTWLPGSQKIFNAFSLPITDVKYVLIGESPYPRMESANGYAFWDAAVNALWSETGLSKQVNRATSLRHLVKMLLIAEGRLNATDTSQLAIAAIDKTNLVQTNEALFTNLLQHGFLLLNATPVLQQSSKPQQDAKIWSPFIQHLLNQLILKQPRVHFILFGKIAKPICHLLDIQPKHLLIAEHPYNLSFMHNAEVINFFKPLHLLRRDS